MKKGRISSYTTYLLDKEYNPILQAGEKVDYSQRVIESGSSGVWDFSMAFNYAYWLYLGFSVGVQHLDYTMTSFYHEDFELGGSMDYNNKFNSSGLGYNVKVGGIIRPFPALRLGVAYHSPTVYVMTDDIVFAEIARKIAADEPITAIDWHDTPNDILIER